MCIFWDSEQQNWNWNTVDLSGLHNSNDGAPSDTVYLICLSLSVAFNFQTLKIT